MMTAKVALRITKIDSELSEVIVSSSIYRYDTISSILSYIKIIRLVYRSDSDGQWRRDSRRALTR